MNCFSGYTATFIWERGDSQPKHFPPLFKPSRVTSLRGRSHWSSSPKLILTSPNFCAPRTQQQKKNKSYGFSRVIFLNNDSPFGVQQNNKTSEQDSSFWFCQQGRKRRPPFLICVPPISAAANPTLPLEMAFARTRTAEKKGPVRFPDPTATNVFNSANELEGGRGSKRRSRAGCKIAGS